MGRRRPGPAAAEAPAQLLVSWSMVEPARAAAIAARREAHRHGGDLRICERWMRPGGAGQRLAGGVMAPDLLIIRLQAVGVRCGAVMGPLASQMRYRPWP